MKKRRWKPQQKANSCKTGRWSRLATVWRHRWGLQVGILQKLFDWEAGNNYYSHMKYQNNHEIAMQRCDRHVWKAHIWTAQHPCSLNSILGGYALNLPYFIFTPMLKFRRFCLLSHCFCQLTKGRPKHQPHPDVTLFYPFALSPTHTHSIDGEKSKITLCIQTASSDKGVHLETNCQRSTRSYSISCICIVNTWMWHQVAS